VVETTPVVCEQDVGQRI